MKNPWSAATAAAIFCACALCFGYEMDPARYIPIDQVKPGMEGWGLTVLDGSGIKKFPLKVLSIVRKAEPGMDFILVVATDEESKYIGSVQGCSGSPVYFDGRLAGALAAAWDQAVDPLYLVRPIQDMLKIEDFIDSPQPAAPLMEARDLMDLPAADQKYLTYLQKTFSFSRSVLPLTASLPDSALVSIEPFAQALGLRIVSGSAAGSSPADSCDSDLMHLVPGGVLGIPLCSGDISMSAVGTVTEVISDRVFGLGHSMLGCGAVQLPMSAGTIHTTIARRSISFKYASTGPILGTLIMDGASGVYGKMGQNPPLLPLHIRVERQDIRSSRDFYCQAAVNPLLTPLLLRSAIQGASRVYGDFPPEHSLEYDLAIRIAGHDPIQFSNVSTDSGAQAPAAEISALTSLLMTNPYQNVEIEGIDVSLRFAPHTRQAQIWSAELSEIKVKPGQWITARVTLQSYRMEKTVLPVQLQIPMTVKPGPCTLQIFSRDEFLGFQQKAAPQRFVDEDMPSMLAVVRRILQTPRNHLTAVLLLGPGGIAIRDKELPNLPPSRAVLLQDTRRFTPAVVMQQWIQTQTETDLVPSGNVTVQLIVEP